MYIYVVFCKGGPYDSDAAHLNGDLPSIGLINVLSLESIIKIAYDLFISIGNNKKLIEKKKINNNTSNHFIYLTSSSRVLKFTDIWLVPTSDEIPL